MLGKVEKKFSKIYLEYYAFLNHMVFILHKLSLFTPLGITYYHIQLHMAW